MPGNHPVELLRALLDASPFGVIATDPEGIIQLWSRGAQQIFQWSEDEMLGRELPADLQPSVPLEANVLDPTGAGEELRSHRKDGSAVHVEIRRTVWRDSQSSPRGTLLIVADTTNRHTLERELIQLTEQESEARKRALAEGRFRELLEAAPDAIIEVDKDGQIVLLNRVTEKMFGYSREELLGRNVDFLIPESLRSTHTAHRERYWSSPQTRAMGSGLRLEAERRDGSRFPVEISLSPVRIGDTFRVTAIVRDITERKQAEDRLASIQEQYTRELTATNYKLEERNRQIERADRLKSEFLASMSHELRTPLNAIGGYAELLALGVSGSLNADQAQDVARIRRSQQHLLTLINDVLNFAKVDAGQAEYRITAVPVDEALHDTESMIAPQIVAKGLKYSYRGGDKTASVLADPEKFQQIVLNLLTNAVKFTDAGGSITLSARPSGGCIDISVADTGAGISPEKLERIFDPFVQAERRLNQPVQGVGLGLAISRDLAHAMGGEITVESTVGNGSTFTLSLPRAPRMDPADVAAASAAAQAEVEVSPPRPTELADRSFEEAAHP